MPDQLGLLAAAHSSTLQPNEASCAAAGGTAAGARPMQSTDDKAAKRFIHPSDRAGDVRQ
jgi:hypothetical protein